MSSLFSIEPYDDEKRAWRSVIETPKGSRNKYNFDPELQAFVLKKDLPAGMTFPYDFGFLPQTRGEDGDPLDVLLLMDAPAFPGCVVESRLIGIIQGKQTERDGKSMRNDRILAVRVDDRIFGNCKDIRELNRGRVDEITGFFITYNQLQDKVFKVLAVRGAAAATAAVKRGLRAFAQAQ